MKLIKPNKLKKGDYIRSGKILNGSDGKFVWNTYTIARIEKTSYKEKKRTFFIKCWFVEEKEETIISEGGGLSPNNKLYLLNKKELMDFNKRLILLSLEEKNGVYG